MLAVRAIYRQGQLEWIEAPPAGAEGMVAVVFLEAGVATDEEMQEAAALAQSPAFHRLVERGLGYIVAEETRPIQALLDELPD